VEGSAGGGWAASFAAPVMDGRTRGEIKRRRVEAVPVEMRGRAVVADGRELPVVSVVAVGRGEGGRNRAALLDRAVHSLEPGVFEELVELVG
jgi:hypothetical protein